jgi:hypothetical protein
MASNLIVEKEDSVDNIVERGPRRARTEVFSQAFTPRRRTTMELPRTSRKGSELALPNRGFVPSRATLKKTLCDFCQTNVIEADQHWGMHHSDYAALTQSAQDGCTMCLQLHEDISSSQIDIESLVWPLYRWNVKSPQRSGDTEEIHAAIVFRQAVSFGPRTHAGIKRKAGFLRRNADFPERTFLLFQHSGTAPRKALKNPSLQWSAESTLIQPAEPLGEDTFSAKTQQTAHRWLEDCRRNHPDCQARADRGFMPTRLLDVWREDRIFVVNTEPSQIKEPYITLSYCWGRAAPISLNRHTQDMLMQEGFPSTNLPRTIREGVLATRALGVRYIWIDSLCGPPNSRFKGQ